METETIKNLAELDRQYIWHPFTQMQTSGSAIAIVKGEGTHLIDENGRRYIDAISSWWVNLHGHSHPYIAGKIAEQATQLEHVLFAGFTHATAVELAARLIALLPHNLSKIFYSDNGSTAVETALKMALQYIYNIKPIHQRKKIICLKHSYHGDTFGAMSAAGRNHFNKPFWSYLFDVESIDAPREGCEGDSIIQMELLLKKGDVVCFIFEPLILGAGGMKIYSLSGLNSLLSLCRKHGVLLIADEVMTGFGRTGPLFASSLLKERPDMICLSKGITGGFLPLGATVCTEEIYNGFLGAGIDKALLHGHSYTANPLACSAALASLDILLTESTEQRRSNIAKQHQNFCLEFKFHPKLKRCEALGTILVLEYATECSLYQHFLDRGILVRPLGNVLYIMPPYCISSIDLEYIYEQIKVTL